MWGIAQGLAERGHDVTLIIGGKKEEERRVNGVNILSLSSGDGDKGFQSDQTAKLICESLDFSRSAAEVIKEIKPDALCLHYGLSSRYLVGLDIPRTYTFHVADVVGPIRKDVLRWEPQNYPRTMFMALMEMMASSPADRLLALNSNMRDYLVRMWRRPVSTVPCGVDPARFEGVDDDGSILFAGRLDWNKNPELLVRAYSLLPDHIQRQHRLRIVGSGSLDHALRSRISRLGLSSHVDVIPWMEHERLSRIMSKCSLFVLPSFVETFGIVLIEAMACRKPVLATDIPGPRDIVIPGHNGFLVPPNNPIMLRDKLQLLLEDSNLRSEMGRNGRSDIETKYSFKAIAREYEMQLEGAIEDRGGTSTPKLNGPFSQENQVAI